MKTSKVKGRPVDVVWNPEIQVGKHQVSFDAKGMGSEG